jgi:hypothetical protein
MKLPDFFALAATLALCPLLASALLAVNVSPVKITGQKAVVPLEMKNGFAENFGEKKPFAVTHAAELRVQPG